MENTDINFKGIYAYTVVVTDKIRELGDKCAELESLEQKLLFYNKNIRSLSFYHDENKLTYYGEKDYFFATSKIFFDYQKSTDEEKKIFLKVRNMEIERLKKEIDLSSSYFEKLKILYKRVGLKKIDRIAWAVESNEWVVFVANGAGRTPPELSRNHYSINLQPINQDQYQDFNKLIYSHIKHVIRKPEDFYHLETPTYNGFLFEKGKTKFEKQLSNAIDNTETINFEISRINNEFEKIYNYEKHLYYYEYGNFKLWQNCLFTAFVNGIDFDFKKKELSGSEVRVLIHVEECFKYYKYLLGLQKRKTLPTYKGEKIEVESYTPNNFYEMFYKSEMVEPCIDLLKQLEPPLIDTDCNYIGKLKSVFCIWIDEMQRQGIIRQYTDRKIFALLIPQKIKRFSIDESMFGKHHKKAETNYRTDIKTMISKIKLSQDSQQGK